MIDIEDATVLETAVETLYPRLDGFLFHATRGENLASIIAAGALLPGGAEGARSLWPPYDGYFRSIGCVSLFDYRGFPLHNGVENRFDCNPFSRSAIPCEIVFLFVDEDGCPGQLIPSSTWDAERHAGLQIVPGLEIGHAGPLPLKCIRNALRVRVEEDPSSMCAFHRRLERERR